MCITFYLNVNMIYVLSKYLSKLIYLLNIYPLKFLEKFLTKFLKKLFKKVFVFAGEKLR